MGNPLRLPAKVIAAVALTGGAFALGHYTRLERTPSEAPRPASGEDRAAARLAALERRVGELTSAVRDNAHTGAPRPVTPPSGAATPEPAAPSDDTDAAPTPESVAAFDAAERMISDAVAHRVIWDEAKREDLRAQIGVLSKSQLETVYSHFFVALNSGKLVASAVPPL